MYIISETINQENIPKDKIEELFKQHRAWFTHHFEQGNFLLVGPYKNREMTGIMLAKAENREALEKILSEDIFYTEDMATYEVYEFVAGKIAGNILDYEGK